MELTGGAESGALGGNGKSERVEEEVAGGGSVRVERLVRPSATSNHVGPRVDHNRRWNLLELG
jgi:hypothetical protein